MELSDIDNFITERLSVSMDAAGRLAHINEVYIDFSRLFTQDQVERNEMIIPVDEEIHVLEWPARRIHGVDLLAPDGKYYPLRKVRYESVIIPREEGMPRRWSPYGIEGGHGVGGGPAPMI